jgi:hypothetical protein
MRHAIPAKCISPVVLSFRKVLKVEQSIYAFSKRFKPILSSQGASPIKYWIVEHFSEPSEVA